MEIKGNCPQEGREAARVWLNLQANGKQHKNVNTVLFKYLHGLKAKKNESLHFKQMISFSSAIYQKSDASESDEEHWTGRRLNRVCLPSTCLTWTQSLSVLDIEEERQNTEPWPMYVGFCFSCQVTSQPILATGVGKEIPNREVLTTSKKTRSTRWTPLGHCTHQDWEPGER